MPEILLTIQEAASVTGKSIQTIRRAVKARKIIAKKKKTPQGFNYMVTQDSIITCYKLDKNLFQQSRQKTSIDGNKKSDNPDNSHNKEIAEFATKEEVKNVQARFDELMGEYRQEKENLMRFTKAFQDRFVVLENQIKLLEVPGRKRWYQFWK